MAGEIRTEDPDVSDDVLDALRSEPWSFALFQAVRLLERALPERAPVGHFADPGSEAVRFLQHASLAFPASEIQDLKWKDSRAEVMVNVASLIGPTGVLPLHYSELAVERLRAHDRTFVDFLNIFHHRVTSEFYRAWQKHRISVGYERENSDPVTSRLYDLVGLGTESLQKRQPFVDELFAHYCGLFSAIPRSQVGLESILADYFDVPVSIEQFVGVWRRLDTCDQTCFEFEFSEVLQLGTGTVVGDEVWDRQSRARIVLGPLKAERYREFLPHGSAFEPLRAVTRMFSGNDVEYELQLILRREEVPGCQLGAQEEAGIQLGWFTWMKSRPTFDRDPGDTVLLLA